MRSARAASRLKSKAKPKPKASAKSKTRTKARAKTTALAHRRAAFEGYAMADLAKPRPGMSDRPVTHRLRAPPSGNPSAPSKIAARKADLRYLAFRALLCLAWPLGSAFGSGSGLALALLWVSARPPALALLWLFTSAGSLGLI
ncbi:hypothetical protein FOZ60_016579, partial [Perkinsus olseni]